jgi:hypothetical protein
MSAPCSGNSRAVYDRQPERLHAYRLPESGGGDLAEPDHAGGVGGGCTVPVGVATHLVAVPKIPAGRKRNRRTDRVDFGLNHIDVMPVGAVT